MADTDEDETIRFLKKNFNYINLLMFIGLFVACFVYLLQDSVKIVHQNFSSAIGIFVAQFLFLLLIYFMFPTDNKWTISWGVLIIAVILELVASLLIVIKYKNLQDIDLDYLDLEYKETRIQSKTMNPYLNYKFTKDFFNFIIAGDVIGFIFFLGLMIAHANEGTENIKNQSFSVLAGLFGITILIISGFLLYFAKNLTTRDPLPNKQYIQNNTNNKKTIPAMILISIFQIFFIFFFSMIISKNDITNSNLFLKLSWSSVFISSLFEIISLIIMIVTYKYLNDNFFSKNIDIPLSDIMKKELIDYNNLLAALTSITIIYVYVLISGDKFLKEQNDFFFDPKYYCFFIIGMGVSVLSMSSEMIKLSNDFLKFKKNSQLPTNASNTNTNTNTNPTSTPTNSVP